MAKAKDTVVIEVPVDWSVTMHGHTLSANDLISIPPAGIAHLIQLGYTTGSKNQAALSADKKASMSDKELADFVAKRRAEYHEGVLKGEVRSGSAGVRATPFERFVRDVTEEKLRAHLASKGAKLPKGDAFRAALEKVYAKLKPAIDAEANKRLAAAQADAGALGDIEL